MSVKSLKEWSTDVLEGIDVEKILDETMAEIEVEDKYSPLLTGHKIIVYRGYVASMQGRWMCVCGTLMASEVMGPALYKEFAAHEAEKLQEVQV